jgi:hypothetical protein
MVKRLLFIFIAFISINTLRAQTRTISGTISDQQAKAPLTGATVRLKSLSDSGFLQNAVTDSAGGFTFSNLKKDSFLLSFSFVGYNPISRRISIDTSDIDLNIAAVPNSSSDLETVIIRTSVSPVTQKGDTLQMSASQYKVNPDATTEDLIKKMPGITVDKDGTVTAQGEQVKKVTIDGREFFGDDATAALRNLPSEVVDKIQVFDRLSDQAQFTGFDDGNSVKAINIVTKSGIKNGQFGRIYAGYGTDNRYAAGGNVSFFNGNRRLSVVGNFNNINQQNFASQDLLGVTSTGNNGGNRGGGNFGGGGNRGGGQGGNRGGNNFGGGENFSVGQQSGINTTNAIGLNFSDKWGTKLDVQGSYFFNNSNNSNDRILKSQTLFKGKTQYTDQHSVSESNNYNHRFNMRFEYRIDSSNSLIVSPSLNFQNNKSLSASNSQTYYGIGDTLNTSNTSSNASRNGYNLRNNILFRHSFAKRGRSFSINLNTTLNKNDGDSYSIGHYRFFDSLHVATDSAQNQHTINPTDGYALSSNIAYTEPIGAKGQLQFNYSPSYSKNKADQQTFLFDELGGKYSRFDTSLSNKFDNTTVTQNGGVTYRLGASRDNQFSAGVNVQHSKLQSQRIFPKSGTVDQSFTTLLPNLMWRKKITTRSSFNIFYRANTNFPSVTQLQDVVNVSNLLRISSGNPDLKQSYTHFLSGRYIFTNTQKGQSFLANLFLQSAQNYISTATFSPRADSVIQQNIIVKKGAQFTKPVNLDGYRSFRSFFTFSQPIKFIKSNINLSTGFSYSKFPGLIDYVKTTTDNYTYNAGVVVASNISEFVDFNVSYNAYFNTAKSSVQAADKYVTQTASLQLNLLSKKGWFVQNDVNNQTNSGLSAGLNTSYWLWNAAVGKKFLKNRAGELKLSAFDLLEQNQSIVRTVSENYIEDTQSKVLQRYFMLTFTYSLRNFGTPPARAAGRNGNFNRGSQ